MSSDAILQHVNEHGWYSGLANLLRKENGLWWGTRKWWIQTLVWLVICNGLLAFLLWGIPIIDHSANGRISLNDVRDILKIFLQLQMTFTTFGVIIFAQGLIVNEKKYGTAAWVLSNPVSRSAIILSKLLSHGWAILVILVTEQCLVAYLQLALKAGTLYNPIPLALAATVVCLYLLFYLTMGLLLGTLFESNGPVIGIPIAVMIGMGLIPQFLGNQLPWLIPLLPDRLTGLTMAIGSRQSLPADWHYAVISCGVLSVLFIILAILRLKREEF